MPRPKLKDGDDTVTLTIRVPRTVRAAAIDKAHRNGTTLAAKLRSAVEVYASTP